MILFDVLIVAFSVVLFLSHRGLEGWIESYERKNGKSSVLMATYFVVTIFLGSSLLHALNRDWACLPLENNWTFLFCFLGLIFYLLMRIARFPSRYD